MSEADARRRIAAQWPLAEKVRRADFVIGTDGTVEETRQQARAVWEALRRRAGVEY
jgi:dephospho-CoA kinase